MRERHRLAVLVAAGIFLAALFTGLIVSREAPEAYDTRIMLQVTRSILDDGGFRVVDDEFGFNSPYASYGLGMSLLFLIPSAIADATGGDAANAAMMTNAFAFGLTAIALLALARTMDLRWSRAAAVAGLTAAGTMLLPYAGSGYSELALAGAIALGLTAVGASTRGRRWAAPLGGVAVGMATLLRTDSLLAVAPAVVAGVLLAVPADRRRQELVRIAAGATPFLVVWAWYNAVRFGNPWTLGYAGTEGFAGDFPAGLFGLTLSPARGLLWYAPLLLVALAGARAAWRLNRPLALAAAIVLVGRLILFASWSSWWGGVTWGPRFLVPAMPALAVGLAGALSRYRRWPAPMRAAVVSVCVISVGVQLVGASTAYEHHWNQFHTKAEVSGDPDAYLFDWKYFPIYHQAGWMVWRTDVIEGRFLPPAGRPGMLAAFTSMIAWGVAAAAYAARRLDRAQGPVAPDGAGVVAPPRDVVAASERVALGNLSAAGAPGSA